MSSLEQQPALELGDSTARRDFTITERLQEATEPISQALARQTGLNTLNFFVGVVLGVGGLFLINDYINRPLLSATSPEQVTAAFETAIRQFCWRLSLIALIEALAFFFLRLYRAGIGDAKYLRAEIATIKLRVLGLRLALELGDEGTVGNILTAFGSADVHGESPRSAEKPELQKSFKMLSEVLKGARELVGADTKANS